MIFLKNFKGNIKNSIHIVKIKINNFEKKNCEKNIFK